MSRKLTSRAGSVLVVTAIMLLFVLNAVQIQAAGTLRQAERVLRLARPTDPQTLDPAHVWMASDVILLPLLNLALLDVVDGTNPVPRAALSWMRSDDARTYAFQLRPGLKFSNGRPLVAADYAYAFERMLDPKTGSPLGAYLQPIHGATAFIQAREAELGQIKPGVFPREGRWIEPTRVVGIRTPGPDTLVIELDQPDPTFPYVLACGWEVPVPREEVERSGASFAVRPIGTGPYVVEEWLRGVRLVFAPNPHYAGREPRYFDRIEIMIGGDPSTHLMMFERGELDIADIENFVIPLADHLRITRDSRWRLGLEQSGIGWFSYVVLNTEMAPLDNPKVRQAFNYAVDKPRRMRSANGRFEPAKGIIPPFMPAHNSALVGYPFDQQRAKALLAAAGVAHPIRLTLWHGLDLDSRAIAEGIQSDLRGIGTEIELKPVTISELNSATTIRSNVPMALTGWICIMPDPKDALGGLFDGRTISNKSTMNVAFYNNPEVNQLLDEAATNVVLSARYALYQRAEEIIVREAPFVFLGYPRAFALKQPWIKGRLIEPVFPFRIDRVWKEQ